MKKKTRMTLEDIVEAKLKRDADKMKVAEIEIPSTGQLLLFKRPEDKLIFELIDGIKEDDEMENLVRLYRSIIYLCCDDLQKPEVLEALEVTSPEDVVESFMGPEDVMLVGDEVCRLNRFYTTFEEEEKNS